MAMLVCLAVVSLAEHQFKLSSLGLVTLFLSFGVVGVIVAWHQPRNPMGWVLLGVTFFFLLLSLATRYDADQTVAAFAARLQDAIDLGTVRSDLLSTVDRALEPAHVTVWTVATPSRPG